MAKELGRIGQRRYSGVFFEEFLHELRGAQGAEIYTEMADNDSTIGAIFFATENLMRNCEFTVEPGGNTAKDKEAAEFVEGCLHDMCNTWTDTLSEILSFITYGWSYHEIVYKRRMGKKPNSADSSKYDDGLIGWKKLPIRSQETLYEWVYKDHTDDLMGMRQMVVTDTDIVDVVIPIDKAMHFITRSRKNNPEGRSVLRTAYRDWYFKKRIMEIEGIGIERDLAGFPTLTAPENMDLWDSEDPDMVAALARAEAIITGIRRDSREGLVLPNGWELQLLSTGSRRQFDTNQIIERYNKQIATSVLTDFVLLGHESVGSFALADNKTKMFSLAVGTYLDIICEVFNNQAIPRLIDINGDHFKGITDYPQMKHGDIEDANLEKIGNFIQQMVGVGALTPDDDLEDYLRKISNLPESKVNIPYEERKLGPQQEQEQPQDPQNPDGMTEEGQTGGANGGKVKTATMYEIKSIMNDYLRGSMPKNMAKDMLRRIGIADNEIERYMSDYDNLRTENERKKMAEKQGKELPKPTPSEESRKEKAKEEKAEKDPDELQDEKEAEEAKKSLGRYDNLYKHNDYHDPDTGRFAPKGSGGYSGRSMSNRAVRAYASGEKPKSKWTKQEIIDEIENYAAENDIDLSEVELKRLTVSELQDTFLEYASWHHTGALYNKTEFYKIRTNAIDTLSKDEVERIVGKRTKKVVTAEQKQQKQTEKQVLEDAKSVYDKLDVIYASNITGLKSLNSIFGRFDNGKLEVDSEYKKALEKLRSQEEARVNQWRKLPEGHWRHTDVALFDSDFESYVKKVIMGGENSNRSRKVLDGIKRKIREDLEKSLGRGEDMPTFKDLLYGAGSVKKAQTFSEILKYNPYHDARGRFTSGGSAVSFVANPNTKAGANAISREKSINAAVESHKQSDKDAIAGNIEKVKASVSNVADPLERQKVDIDKIMKEGGCDRETAKKAAAEAKAIYDKVSKAEPQITADIVGAVSANNGKMYGLKFRMKQETSLGRKIASDAMGEFNGDIKAAASEVKDAVRYTAVFDTSNFTQGYKNVKQSLEAKGYKEDRCKNFFADYAEGTSVQKAVQCVYSDKNGNRLELQFHTYDSQGAKEVNHPLYEQSRAASTSKADKVILSRRMINISSNVNDPKGVMSIERHK